MENSLIKIPGLGGFINLQTVSNKKARAFTLAFSVNHIIEKILHIFDNCASEFGGF